MLETLNVQAFKAYPYAIEIPQTYPCHMDLIEPDPCYMDFVEI